MLLKLTSLVFRVQIKTHTPGVIQVSCTCHHHQKTQQQMLTVYMSGSTLWICLTGPCLSGQVSRRLLKPSTEMNCWSYRKHPKVRVGDEYWEKSFCRSCLSPTHFEVSFPDSCVCTWKFDPWTIKRLTKLGAAVEENSLLGTSDKLTIG